MSGGFEMPHQTSKRKKQGFGGGKAKKPPQQGKTLTTGEAVARHMLLEYNAIKADGGKVARVHARLKDTDEWFPVGNVSANQQYLTRRFLSLVVVLDVISSGLASLRKDEGTSKSIPVSVCGMYTYAYGIRGVVYVPQGWSKPVNYGVDGVQPEMKAPP